MIYASQMKAARGLLGWEQKTLSEKTSLSLQTIKRMEGSQGKIRGTHENVSKIREAFEEAGIEFIPENGGGAGLRFKHKHESAD